MIYRMKGFFRLNQDNEIFIYFWFFFLCVLCYGILIPFLGFYWDDLPYLFQYHSFGISGFPEFVSSDRPFSAWIFMLTTGLFKFNPLGYHLLAFFLRFVGVVLFYLILKELWPNKKAFIFFSSSIFAVYPGFLQQPIALIYCHHFSVLAIFLFSILLMIKVAKSEKINGFLFGLSILGSFHMFSIENFAMLELIRPFILWLVLKKQNRDEKTSSRKLFLLWSPFVIVFIFFLVWRIFIFKFPTYQPGFFEDLKQDPSRSILDLFSRIPVDLYTTSVGAWIKSFSIPQFTIFGRSATLLFWVLTIFTFVIAFVFSLTKAEDKKFQQENDRGNFLLFLGGIVLFLLAGSIVWGLGLPLDINFAWDRMTLAFIPAIAILIGAILDSPKKYRTFSNAFFALLISAAVGSHFENGMRYKRDWEDFKNMQIQLSWRIPSLEKNTTLVTDELSLRYYSDNSLTAAFNWQYSKEIRNYQLPYVIIFTNARMGGSLHSLDQGTRITQKYRTNYFNGSTDQLILFYHLPPGCVHIADPDLDVFNPLIPKEIRPYASLSKLDLIKKEEDLNSVFFIEDQPVSASWCFYYQKASLAVQNHRWEEAAHLGDLAFESDDYPNDASERLPFIEAYAMQGDWEKAKTYSNKTIEVSELYRPMICRLWERISSTYNDEKNSETVEPQKYLSSICISNK